MKYFTKYLPVDGKVSGGDKACISSTGQLLGFEGGDSHAKALDKDGYKPARLFLCSKDIGVGDKIMLSSNTPEAKEVHPDDLGRAKELGCFKVIGEISPTATWVTEGMEFEEGEIQIILSRRHNCTCKDTNYSCIHMEDDRRGGSTCMREDVYWLVKIKCPTCQTFH